MVLTVLIKPGIMFSKDLEMKPFGIGDNKTMFSFGVFAIVTAIFSFYLFSIIDMVFV